jgi:acylphosphatase
MDRVLLVITGQVQAVGFRWYVQRAATLLGLSGEVRNRADGAVVVEAEGARDSLERLIEATREGPVTASVTAVDVRWSEGPARHHGFHIARST